MANYGHKTGYVIQRDDGRYISGYGYDKNKERCTYWTPWINQAKIWTTRRGADQARTPGTELYQVKLDPFGRYMDDGK